MLAYIFWHWPKSTVAAAAYEADLVAYHTALDAITLPGYHGSAVYRLEGAPWIAAPGMGYEDWYLIDGSAVLDPLNEVAVSTPLREAHDRCAHAADGGAGGLYRLRRGEAVWPEGGEALWFAKPAGISYAALDAQLEAALEAGGSLWRRQMALGPALEFCLRAPRPVELPTSVAPVRVRRAPVYAPEGTAPL